MAKRQPEGNASGDEHDELRAVLLRRRRLLLEQVVRVHDDLEWLDSNLEIEAMEESQEETLANVLAQLGERDRAQLAEIDAALTRLVRGEYGRCRSCGEPIPLARLRAMPTTEWCRPCAELREGLPPA